MCASAGGSSWRSTRDDAEGARSIVERLAAELFANPLIEAWRGRAAWRAGGMRVGVVVFPGSNCDRDALHGVELAGAEPVALWHEEHRPARRRRGHPAGRLRLRRLPAGGRAGPLQPGHGRGARPRRARAAWCWASATASRCSPRPACVPGALLRNASLRFEHRWVRLARRAARHAVHAGHPGGHDAAHARSPTARATTSCPTPSSTRWRRAAASSSATRRRRATPTARRATSPASSTQRGNVCGLMPHPERAAEAAPGLGRRAAAVALARRERPGQRRRRMTTVRDGRGGHGPSHAAPPRAGPDRRGAGRPSRRASAAPPTTSSWPCSASCGASTARTRARSRCCATLPDGRRGRGRRARARTPASCSIGDGLAVAFKLESHNHPSAVEPYQGAATGVGGILRDIFTMGARPIAVLDALKFGDPDDDADAPPRARRRPRRRRLRQLRRRADGRRRARLRPQLRRQPAGQRDGRGRCWRSVT